MATFTRRRHPAGSRSRQTARYLSRGLFNRRLYYRSNHRLYQRQMFGYYSQVARIEQWMKTVCKAIFLLVFTTCILHFSTPKSRTYLTIYNLLYRSAVWFCITSIAYLVSLLCSLFFQKDSIQRSITQTWNRLNQRFYRRNPSRTVNNRPPWNRVEVTLPQEEPSFTSRAKSSQIEEFLNIIARDFAEDCSSLGENSAENLQTRNDAEADSSNQSPGDKDEGEQNRISLRISNQSLFEPSNSAAEKDVDGTSDCRLSFSDFIKLLKKVNCRSGKEVHSSSLSVIVLKYKEKLLEKVKLSDDYQQVTCVKEFYEFIERNWDEWFPESVSSNITSEERFPEPELAYEN